MAMSVVYSNAFGGVFAENRGGVVSIYVPDTQGSAIGLVSSSGVLTDRWVYWPYGEVASRTGTNVTPLTWLGTLGYFLDQVSKLLYVRARHLRADLERWLTVDPRWPAQPGYAYVDCAPTLGSDPAGQGTICPSGYEQTSTCLGGGSITVSIGSCGVTRRSSKTLCGDTCSGPTGYPPITVIIPDACPNQCKKPNLRGACLSNISTINSVYYYSVTVLNVGTCYCQCPITTTITLTICACCSKGKGIITHAG